MKRKINLFCACFVALTLTVTVVGVKANTEKNIQIVDLDTYAASEDIVSTTASLGDFVSEKVDGFTGAGEIIGDISDVAGDLGNLGGGLFDGIGDSFSGLGDSLGGILGGLGAGASTTAPPTTEPDTYKVDKTTSAYIEPVPYATVGNTTTTEEKTDKTDDLKETVDFSATQNPFKKPTGELKGGDKGEGVKWMQWVFIYTRYGLKDDGITGVFDEDTIAVVKKLQKEKGLEVDGIVDSEVIAQIDLLYYEAVYGNTSSTAFVASSSDSLVYNTAPVSNGDADNSLANGGTIIAIVLALIWIIAIGLIVILFLIKRKKKKNGKKSNTDTNDSVATETSKEDKTETEKDD